MPELDNDAAVLAQPMATVLSALSTLPGVIGKTVAVVGQGPIGLLFNHCLSRLGAARIIGIDVLERARRAQLSVRRDRFDLPRAASIRSRPCAS